MDKPPAWYDPTNHHVSTDKNDPLFTPLGQVWPLYPKREWVGLTDDERINISYKSNGNECVAVELTEAALRSKNT
jgi:hypothetical protein